MIEVKTNPDNKFETMFKQSSILSRRKEKQVFNSLDDTRDSYVNTFKFPSF